MTAEEHVATAETHLRYAEGHLQPTEEHMIQESVGCPEGKGDQGLESLRVLPHGLQRQEDR
jgi:hypothetical protein